MDDQNANTNVDVLETEMESDANLQIVADLGVQNAKEAAIPNQGICGSE